ncbi:ABC transporter permease [Streptococcus caprae]|uniref:ABC transporter permease n=1 Tax=Streptococcus caprae TaxID=1640501 RepID=A0ABV8CXL1_9STRE
MIGFEFKKMRKSAIPILLIVFNLIGTGIGTLIFAANRQYLVDGTESLVLWGQTVFYASQLFSPILLAIICSISCQFEEQEKNWQRLLSLPMTVSQILKAKFLSLAFVSLVCQLIVLVFFLISAVILQVPLENWYLFIFWTVTGWFGTLPIIASQLFLSIRLSNFSVPVLLATILSVVGLGTLFIGQGLFQLFPYNWIVIGERARALSMFSLKEFSLFIGLGLVYIVLFYNLAKLALRKRFV